MKIAVAALLVAMAFATEANEFADLAKKCAPAVSVDTLSAIVRTESGFNPFAIGVVGGAVKQPTTLQDAVLIATKLATEKRVFSVGLAQINSANFSMLNTTAEKLFDPCENLKAAQIILTKCYARMSAENKSEAQTLADAISCYYSGNATTGYKHGYVARVIANAPTVRIPSISLLTGANIPEQQHSESNSLISSGADSPQRGSLIF